MLKKTHLAFLLLSVFVVAAASGAPMLRLNIPRATVAMPDALQGSTGEHLPVWIPAGTDGPVNIADRGLERRRWQPGSWQSTAVRPTGWRRNLAGWRRVPSTPHGCVRRLECCSRRRIFPTAYLPWRRRGAGPECGGLAPASPRNYLRGRKCAGPRRPVRKARRGQLRLHRVPDRGWSRSNPDRQPGWAIPAGFVLGAGLIQVPAHSSTHWNLWGRPGRRRPRRQRHNQRFIVWRRQPCRAGHTPCDQRSHRHGQLESRDSESWRGV